MATFLKSFFKPRKSGNEARPARNRIDRLTPDRDDQRAQLENVARHSEDPSLRLAAIERLDRIEWLIPLYDTASHRERAFIAQRVSTLSENPESIARAKQAFSDSRMQQILEQLTSSPEDDMVQVSAETDAAELERLAIEGQTANLRKSALELVSDEEALSRIARAAKGRDKTVYQTARQKLHEIREFEARNRQLREEIAQILDAIEEHARTENMQLYEARLDAFLQQWENLASEASREQKARFESALLACRQRLEAFAAEAASEQAEKDKREQRQATLALLEKTVGDLQAAPVDDTPPIPALDALIKTQENRWLEATRETGVDRQEQKRYQELMLTLRQFLQAHQHLGRERDALEQLLEQLDKPDTEESRQLREHQRKIRQTLERIGWPEDFSEPDLLVRARGRLGAVKEEQKRVSADQKARQTELRKVIDELDKTLEEKVLKASVRLFKEAQHLFGELDEHHQHSLQARMHLLGKQLQELKDWQGFVTRPKQIELCEHMEYLASQHMEPEAKAQKIRELQHEWRELGGSSDQKLWQRFKQASDQAYAPCHEYFGARLELKHANVHKRQIIVDQLAEFLENIDWDQCQWKAVERIQRQARDEWRAAWPVDFRENRPLQKRFDALMKDLDHHLDAERRRNEAIKRDIVEKAQQLIEHEPLGEATQQAKSLQQEWQAAGITRQREDRKLWQAFRHACDAIFARRDQQRNQQHAEEGRAHERAGELLEALEQLLDKNPAQLDEARPLMEEFRHLHLSRQSRSEMMPRFHRIESRIADVRQRQKAQNQRENWLNLVRTHAQGELASENHPNHWRRYPLPSEPMSPGELCIRAEIISGLASPEGDAEQRMQLQVNRLAEGLNQGQSWRDAAEEMDYLVACWCQLKPAPDDDAFRDALARFESALGQPLA